MLSIHHLSLEELTKLIVEAGEKSFRAKQIFHWIYEKRVCDWEKMTDLNQPLRAK
jgi:23S rRNA (adenine2503-C2)-methyltransferase